MSPIELLSADRADDDSALVTLSGPAKVNKLKPSLFSLIGSDGQAVAPEKVSFVNNLTILVETPASFGGSTDVEITYTAPKKDKKRGVIQDKKGVDAASSSVTVSPSESEEIPRVDPLTNAWTYDGNTYQLIKKNKSWLSANDDAIARGGYLAVVDDQEENQIIFDNVIGRLTVIEFLNTRSETPGGIASYVWLGASDIQTEGQWIWAQTGDRVTLEAPPWGIGPQGRQPDNFGGSQDGLAMGLEDWPINSGALGQAGQWNDQAIIEDYFYVVEYDGILPIA